MQPAAISETTPEADLVLRHRYVDEEAFAEIFDRFQGIVYNLAYRMSGNEADAQDLSQEVFLRIHRHLGGFRGGSSLKTWIYRITMNHCHSQLGRRRLATVPLDPGPERPSVDAADPRRGPEERAMAHDEQALVQRALLTVAPPFRQAVVLRDIEGLSYQEIAGVLRVNIGTVRSRIARGRAQLREALESSS